MFAYFKLIISQIYKACGLMCLVAHEKHANVTRNRKEMEHGRIDWSVASDRTEVCL